MKRKVNKSKKVTGAFDKDGMWWYEDDIRVFSGGMIELCFGKPKEKIEIIERPK